jgi:hypothetical protein
VRLLIAIITPTTAVAAETALSALRLQAACAARGWTPDFRILWGPAADDSRESAVRQARRDGSDALFLLDNDLAVEPDLLLRMVDSGHGVVGAIHPRPAYDWSSTPDGAPLEVAATVRNAIRFEGELEPSDAGLEIVDGFARARWVSAKCLLLRREALDQLGAEPVFASGSAAFTGRWRALGETLWADVVSPVTVIGRVVNRTPFLEHLRLTAGAVIEPVPPSEDNRGNAPPA